MSDLEADPQGARGPQQPGQARAPKTPADTVLVTPRRAITRYRPAVIAAIVGTVMLVVGLGFIIGLGGGGSRKSDKVDPPSSSAEDVTPLETGLPARYDDPAALPAAGTGGLPPPEGASSPSGAGSGGAASSTSGAAARPVSPEVQRARQEAQAARASGPFFGASGGHAVADVAPGQTPAALPAGAPGAPVQGPALSPKEQFIAQAAARGPGAPILPRPPLSPFEIKAGTLIPAALLTGINSDLPGAVIAQVTEPVFDHRTGRIALIPQGARLLGRYDSQVGYGQERVLVVWTQLIFPSGRSVDLGAMVGVDASGAGGLTGRVDAHLPRLAKAVGLSTLISVGAAAAQNSAGRGDDRVVLQDAAGGVASAASQTGQKLVERDLQRPPTIRVAPGAPLRVLIDRDLILPPEAGAPR